MNNVPPARHFFVPPDAAALSASRRTETICAASADLAARHAALRVGVVIATRGRPQLAARVVDELTRQTTPPSAIVIAVSNASDAPRTSGDRITIVNSAPGLTAQRNAGLDAVGNDTDIVVFFDDDFLPSRYWLENLRLLFASRADIVGVTGAVLADGIKAAGLTWDEAARLVEDADQGPEKTARFIKNDYSPYGCNMAFRRSAIGELRFDERLVLYGWQEDTDFGARIAKHGCCVFSNALWGVHLGSKNGRGPTDETVRAIRNAPPVQRATPGRRDTARRIPLPSQNP